MCISPPRQWFSLKSTWRPRREGVCTPHQYSVSPVWVLCFLIQAGLWKVGDRFTGRFRRLLIWGVAEVPLQLVGTICGEYLGGGYWGQGPPCWLPKWTGEIALGVSCLRPSASSSACTFLKSTLKGRVNIPFRGSHWSTRTPHCRHHSCLSTHPKAIDPLAWCKTGFSQELDKSRLVPFTKTRSPTSKVIHKLPLIVSEDRVLDAFHWMLFFLLGSCKQKKGSEKIQFHI